MAAKKYKAPEPTAAQRAADGASKGSIGGPYGAIFGGIDGYLNGPLYKTTVPKKKDANGIEFGSTPKAAEYMPVSINTEQLNAILGNLRNLDDADTLMQGTNAAIDADALRRAVKFIPNYKENMRLEGQASNDLLNGRLPYDDVLGIVANRQGLSNTLGTPGGSSNASLRDLGLSRLDAIKTGSGLMQGMVSIAEMVNPVSRRMKPQDVMINPTDRIRTLIEQNQLIQQSTQNKYNLKAGLSPSQQAMSQLQLAGMFGGAGGASGGAGDYAQLASQALALYGGMAGGGGGAGSSFSSAAVPTVVGGGYSYTNAGGFKPSTSIPA